MERGDIGPSRWSDEFPSFVGWEAGLFLRKGTPRRRTSSLKCARGHGGLVAGTAFGSLLAREPGPATDPEQGRQSPLDPATSRSSILALPPGPPLGPRIPLVRRLGTPADRTPLRIHALSRMAALPEGPRGGIRMGRLAPATPRPREGQARRVDFRPRPNLRRPTEPRAVGPVTAIPSSKRAGGRVGHVGPALV